MDATKISCENGTEIVQLKVTFTDATLKPKDETDAVLIMTRSFNNIALLNGVFSGKNL